jgi:hypothetical protein
VHSSAVRVAVVDAFVTQCLVVRLFAVPVVVCALRACLGHVYRAVAVRGFDVSSCLAAASYCSKPLSQKCELHNWCFMFPSLHLVSRLVFGAVHCAVLAIAPHRFGAEDSVFV